MRRGKAVIPCLIALLATAMPFCLNLGGSGPVLLLQQTEAKDGNNGNGNGNGNEKGSGTDNSSSGGDSGGSGDAGNKSVGGGAGKNAGSARAAHNKKNDDRAATRADSVVAKEATENSVQIRYRNGYREQVINDRFIMKDPKGRTIIDRRATGVDRLRLWLKQAVP